MRRSLYEGTRIVTSLLVCVFLAACFGDEVATQGPRTPSVRPKAKPAVKQAASATPTPKQRQYTYSPVGKRDPFRSYLAELEDSGRAQIGSKRQKTELERFTLDQLRLTGIISGIAVPIAMVEDPRGEGHQVKLGTRMGTNGGRVSAILRDRLIVTETFHDAAGRRRQVRQELIMPQENLIFGR